MSLFIPFASETKITLAFYQTLVFAIKEEIGDFCDHSNNFWLQLVGRQKFNILVRILSRFSDKVKLLFSLEYLFLFKENQCCHSTDFEPSDADCKFLFWMLIQKQSEWSSNCKFDSLFSTKFT